MTSPSGSIVKHENIGLLLGFVAVVIFGATLPLTRLAVGDLGPWFITFGRAAVAGLIAIVVLGVLRRPFPTRAQVVQLAFASVFLVIGFPMFIGLALRSVPSAHGGVVLGILPLATSLAATLLHGARPSTGFWICGGIGALVVVAFALRQGGGSVGAGDLLLLAAIVCTAIGYSVSSELSAKMPGWEVISWCVVFALPLTLPASFLSVPADFRVVAWGSWVAFAYLGVMSAYVGFFAWNAGLAMGGTARVSQIQLLQTFVTLALSGLINGEQIGVETLLFAVLVLAIVFLGRQFRAR